MTQIRVSVDDILAAKAEVRRAGSADGAPSNAQSLTADITAIGRNAQGNNEFFVDDIAAIRIYLSVLTLSEVQAVEADIPWLAILNKL